MSLPANTLRYVLRTATWTLAVGLTWLLAAQALAIAMSVDGAWQWPRLRQVKVMRTDTDPKSTFTDLVTVTHQGETRVLRMLKAERAELQVDEAVWVLDNVYTSSVRPAQYRASFLRLLLTFGPLLLPLLVAGLRWEHRRPLVDPNTSPRPGGQARKVLTDDFHRRADRHQS